MRIVHASDLHVGSPLMVLRPYPGAPFARLHELRFRATLLALRQLVDFCLRERVQLLLIAGDLFDGRDRHYDHALFFVNELVRLGSVGVSVVWVRGNHDAASGMLWHLPLPWNAVELGLHGPETLVLEELGVVVHGVSYGEPEVRHDLSLGYPRPIPGMLNIGLLHTSAEGRPGHDRYAPCRTRQLAAHGYDYWALGHPHCPEVAQTDPLVVFSGNLQGRNFRERGPRGAMLLDVSSAGISVVHHALDVVRFARCTITATTLPSFDALLHVVKARLSSVAHEAGDRPVVVRLFLRGLACVRTLLAEPAGARVRALRAAANAVSRDTPGLLLDQIWVELPEPPRGLWRLDGSG